MKFETIEYFKNLGDDSEIVKLNDIELKQLQGTLLEILKDFDNVCRLNDISYSLAGGTALGAIRHHGFVPWDDDVDLLIDRINYEKFRNCFKEAMGNRYWLHDPVNRPDLGLGSAKIRKKGTVYRSRDDLGNDESGIFIDLFFVDNTFDNTLLRKLHGFLSLAAGFLLSCRSFYRNRKLYLSLSDNYVFRIKVLFGFILSFLPVSFYTRQWDSINRMCKNGNSKYVTVPCGRKHFFKELYKREDIDNTELMSFEKLSLPVCVGYDTYLRQLYGDYREIPLKKESHIVLEYKNEKNN